MTCLEGIDTLPGVSSAKYASLGQGRGACFDSCEGHAMDAGFCQHSGMDDSHQDKSMVVSGSPKRW